MPLIFLAKVLYFLLWLSHVLICFITAEVELKPFIVSFLFIYFFAIDFYPLISLKGDESHDAIFPLFFTLLLFTTVGPVQLSVVGTVHAESGERSIGHRNNSGLRWQPILSN